MLRQALNKPTYPLQAAYVFTEYQSRIDYQVNTGRIPPPFDPAHRIKAWEDPEAKAKAARLGLTEGETLPYTMARNYAGQPFTNADGTLRIATIGIPVDEAGRVNLPDPGTAPSTAFSAYPVPVPIELAPSEMLVFGKGPMGATNIEIRNTLVPEEHGATANPADLTDIRATLQAIQRTLNTLVGKLG